MMSIAPRLERIFSNTDAERILLMNTTQKDSYFTYLTGLYAGSFESSILIAHRKKAELITTVLEYDVAKRMCPKEIDVIAAESRSKTMELLKGRLMGKAVGINGTFLPVNLYRSIRKTGKPKRMTDVSKALASARQIKDWPEVELIGIANNIVKKAFSKITGNFRVGMTEKELASEFESLMKKYGADEPSFETIVCFGANSAVPHHVPGRTKLEPNSFVLIDAGARYLGYCSDVTRTFIFKPDMKSDKYRRMLEMYNTVKEAQEIALKSIRPGVRCEVPHNKAMEYINKAHNGIYKGRFIHGLGHSLGIDVHDVGPNLSPGYKEKIQENMVFSDEPGIYIEGFGGVRIEDDVLVTKSGGKFL